MLNIWPWKLLKPHGPVNEPSTGWFNAVTRVLATLKVRVDQTGTKCYIDRPNTDGNGWSIVIPMPAGAGLDRQLFRVTRVDDTHVAVHGGTWFRWWGSEYTKASLTVDGGTTSGFYDSVKTLTISESCFIGLTLTDETNATALAASVFPTFPTTNASNIVRIIAWVPFEDGAVGVPEQFHLGDIYTAWNLAYAGSVGETPNAQKGTSKMLQSSLSISATGATVTGSYSLLQFTVDDGKLIIQEVNSTPFSFTIDNVANAQNATNCSNADYADLAGGLDDGVGGKIPGATGFFLAPDGAGGTMKISVVGGLITGPLLT